MNSYTPSLAELELRVTKLERQNRKLKRLGLLFVLIAGSGLLLAQTPRKPAHAAPPSATPTATYDTLVVHRLELRDKAGKLRGLWTLDDLGSALELYHAGGNPCASLIVTTVGTSLQLYNTAGKPRAVLRVMLDAPLLALYDAAGQSRATLDVTPGGPLLRLYAADGKPRAGLGVSPDGPGLALYDAAGTPRTALVVTAADPGLWLYDGTGKPRAALAEDTFSLTDAQGFKAVFGVTETETIRTGEKHTTSAATVTLFSKDGRVIWQAP